MIDPLVMPVILSVLVVIKILRVLFVKIGAWWLRLSLIVLLITILPFCVDKIGKLVGHDIISDDVSYLIAIASLIAISFAFESARIRSSYLRRAERERSFDLHENHKHTIELYEGLREKDQAARIGYDWAVIPKPKIPELAIRHRTDTG